MYVPWAIQDVHASIILPKGHIDSIRPLGHIGFLCICTSLGPYRIYMHLYSCPSLVVPNTEELISRPFLGENRFWWVLQNRMSTENAVGCLFFSHAHFCLQLQQYSLAPMVLVGGFSSGFPMLRTTSICQGTNPCDQKWQLWPTSMGTMVVCSCVHFFCLAFTKVITNMSK